MSSETAETEREPENDGVEEIETDQQYKIEQDGEPIAEGLSVHREVGTSEFDYVLLGSDPDQNSTSGRNAFGFHADELPQVPRPIESGSGGE